MGYRKLDQINVLPPSAKAGLTRKLPDRSRLRAEQHGNIVILLPLRSQYPKTHARVERSSSSIHAVAAWPLVIPTKYSAAMAAMGRSGQSSVTPRPVTEYDPHLAAWHGRWPRPLFLKLLTCDGPQKASALVKPLALPWHSRHLAFFPNAVSNG